MFLHKNKIYYYLFKYDFIFESLMLINFNIVCDLNKMSIYILFGLGLKYILNFILMLSRILFLNI